MEGPHLSKGDKSRSTYQNSILHSHLATEVINHLLVELCLGLGHSAPAICTTCTLSTASSCSSTHRKGLPSGLGESFGLLMVEGSPVKDIKMRLIALVGNKIPNATNEVHWSTRANNELDLKNDS